MLLFLPTFKHLPFLPLPLYIAPYFFFLCTFSITSPSCMLLSLHSFSFVLFQFLPSFIMLPSHHVFTLARLSNTIHFPFYWLAFPQPFHCKCWQDSLSYPFNTILLIQFLFSPYICLSAILLLFLYIVLLLLLSFYTLVPHWKILIPLFSHSSTSLVHCTPFFPPPSQHSFPFI